MNYQRVLMIENSPDDAALILRILSKNFKVTHQRVESANDMLIALKSYEWDLVLSDFNLPNFSGQEAFRILKSLNLILPFILVSGEIGEEIAVEAMKLGVDDYVLKGNLSRLNRSILRELQRAEMIRERVLVEKALRKSETRLQRLMNSKVIGITFNNDEGIVIDANDTFLKMVGYSREDMNNGFLNRSTLRLPEDLLNKRLMDKEHIDSLAMKPIEKDLLCKDGSRVSVHVGIFKLDETDTETMKIYIDISENKRAQETIIASEKQYQQLLETAEEGIWLVDSNGITLLVNPKMASMLNYTVSEMIGRSFLDFLSEKEKVSAMSEFRLREQGHRLQREVIFPKKDGGQIVTLFVSNPIKDKQGNSVGLLAMFMDITERKLSQEQLARTEEELRQSQKMEAIGRLAGGVAHDFNNILAIISLSSEIIKQELPVDHPLHEINQNIFDAQNRGAGLTHQLLSFSRKQAVVHKIFNLNDLISQLDKMLRPLVGEDIELMVELSDTAALINGDPGQIEQIIMNLVVNARDAIERIGRITLKTECIDSRIKLSVIDTGMGMTEETKSKIFEPFFTTKEVGKGTGLGLAAVHGVLNQMNGFVTVDSILNQGTSFHLFFPRHVSLVQCDLNKTSVSNKLKKEISILLVEDEDLLSKVIERMLISNGYQVFIAANGVLALDLIENSERAIDLIITDVVMPQMGGTELVEKVRLIKPDTKVIFMSGYTEETLHKYGVSGQEDYFIEKPFKSESLLTKIDEIFHHLNEEISTVAMSAKANN